MADADDTRMTFALEDGEVEFDPNFHLTSSVLRHVKQWFGAELGRFWPFQLALRVGDPDAAACAIWAVRRSNGLVGKDNPDPRNGPDFPIGKVVLAPNRDEDAEPPRWTLRLPGEDELVFDLDEDLTHHRLQRIKKWFGVELGQYTALHTALLLGDPDAVACAIWAAKDAKGITPNPTPRDMEDFAVGAVSVEPNRDDEAELPEAKQPEFDAVPLSPRDTKTKPPDGSFEETRMNSGDTSLRSATSATSELVT